MDDGALNVSVARGGGWGWREFFYMTVCKYVFSNISYAIQKATFKKCFKFHIAQCPVCSRQLINFVKMQSEFGYVGYGSQFTYI